MRIELPPILVLMCAACRGPSSDVADADVEDVSQSVDANTEGIHVDAGVSPESSGPTIPDASMDVLTLVPPPPPDYDAATPSQCVLGETSTLPHVHIVFHVPRCSFTLAEAAAGVAFGFDIVVDQDVPGFTPDAPYDLPRNGAGGWLANLEVRDGISGGNQSYCFCDVGPPWPSCPIADGGILQLAPTASCPQVTIPAGTYHGSLAWYGRNWNGPSDTLNPMGAPFPPGNYEFDVSTTPGTIVGVGSGLTATARLQVQLTAQ